MKQWQSIRSQRANGWRWNSVCCSRWFGKANLILFETIGRCLIVFAVIGGFTGTASCFDSTSFPSKPIRLVVYTKPGGAIDTTARKFADIAAEYTTATFVVENKPGAGGIVAMKDVLQAKADGYTILACTKSNIAKIVATGDSSLIEAFHWVSMLMADPECVITRRDIGPSTWAELVTDAREKKGRQIWAGPAFGGLDHVMAMKTWEKASIEAVWVPFQSGAKAKAELLGGRSVAYVGNPSEVRANPNKLMVAAVASAVRLRQFPDVPTFAELGLEGLEQEIMWRGFALRNGVKPEIAVWYEDLFRRVSADPKWRDFFEKDGIEVVFHESRAFTETVLQDHKDFTTYLGQLGILNTDAPAVFTKTVNSWMALVVLAVICVVIGSVLRRMRHTEKKDSAFRGVMDDQGMGREPAEIGELLIPISLLLLGALLFGSTCTFPATDEVGAAAVPRLWLTALLPLSLVLLLRHRRVGAEHPRPLPRDIRRDGQTVVIPLFALLLTYVVALGWLGYYVSTFLFLVPVMMLLGERGWSRILGVTLGWLVFSYVVFAQLLYVPLPTGRLFEWLF